MEDGNTCIYQISPLVNHRQNPNPKPH